MTGSVVKRFSPAGSGSEYTTEVQSIKIKKVRRVSLGRDKGTKECHQPDETFVHNKSRNVSLIQTKVGQFVSNVFDKLTHKPEHAQIRQEIR